MNKLLCSFAACILATTQVIAASKIEPLRKNDLNATQFCQFFTTKASASVVLELKYWEAKMRLNDNLVRLNVEEKKCLRDCVSAGRSGVRVFQLSGPGVTAILTKNVTCARDAEVCIGLQEGNARLEVSTSAGHTVMSIWGEYCDM